MNAPRFGFICGSLRKRTGTPDQWERILSWASFPTEAEAIAHERAERVAGVKRAEKQVVQANQRLRSFNKRFPEVPHA